MVFKPRPSITKRQKEQARQEKARHKAEKRAQTRQHDADGKPLPEGEDPDIAGIVPGPQPLPED